MLCTVRAVSSRSLRNSESSHCDPVMVTTVPQDTRPPFQIHKRHLFARFTCGGRSRPATAADSVVLPVCVCLVGPFAGGWKNGSLLIALRYRDPSGMGGERRFARRCRGSDAIRSAGCGHCEQSLHTHGGREQPRCRCRPCIQV